jgi:hypothetical protein
MTDRYPRIRFYLTVEGEERIPCIQTSLSICFYIRQPHQEVILAVMSALETYREAIGRHSLVWSPDGEGDWKELREEDWERQRQKMLHPRGATVWLRDTSHLLADYEFKYFGRDWDGSEGPALVSAVEFWLPVEYLETHGPAEVRKLVIALGAKLPFNSGHAGLSFYCDESTLGMTKPLREPSLRHPGLDMPSIDSFYMKIGTRVKGAYWLTFLGSPVLDHLGGAAGLRARLHSPGTQVEEMSGNRAVVTLGEWPEAGDLEHGHTLPAYRELARVLEPWLYQAPRSPWSGFSLEDVRRWERRFLDEPA